jgi:hypothetical protein
MNDETPIRPEPFARIGIEGEPNPYTLTVDAWAGGRADGEHGDGLPAWVSVERSYDGGGGVKHARYLRIDRRDLNWNDAADFSDGARLVHEIKTLREQLAGAERALAEMRTIPPVDTTVPVEKEAAHAAEEVSAWLAAPPLSDEDRATAFAWFRRLRTLMDQIANGDEALLDVLYNAEGFWSAYSHRAILAARDDALRTLEYAVRMREALEGLSAFTEDDDGYLDPAEQGPFIANLVARDALRENPPAPTLLAPGSAVPDGDA